MNLKNLTIDGDRNSRNDCGNLGVFLYSGSVDNCVFKNCSKALTVDMMPFSTVSNSTFKDNYQWGIVLNGGNARNESNFWDDWWTIKNCAFINNGNGSDLPDNFRGAIYNENAKITNCTIVNNFTAIAGHGNNLRNSIIWGNTMLMPADPYNNFCGDQFSYCNSDYEVPGTGNISADPLFKDPGHGDYSLRFDGLLVNQSVDSGNPDLDNDGLMWYEDTDDQDSDGTRMDRGAIPLIDGHVQGAHILKGGKVAYISFPGMINPDLGNPEHHSEYSSFQYKFNDFSDNNLLLNPPLTTIESLESKTNETNLNITGQNLSSLHLNEYFACSQYGYKIKLLDTSPEYRKVIQYKGYRPGNVNNVGMYDPLQHTYTRGIFIRKPLDGEVNCIRNDYSQSFQREIYLGYYLKKSMKPFDALGPIINNVVEINAKDWSMVRLPRIGYNPNPSNPMENYTNNWLGCVSTGTEPTINPGEMVVVKYLGLNDVVFKWGGENPEPFYTNAYYREMPSYFGFEEQPDYRPIFVQMNLDEYEDGNKPVEIAVFVDNQCKGAAVIKEGQVQLNAYILNGPTPELKDLEFRLWFPGKSSEMAINSYYVIDNKTGRYEMRPAKVTDCKDFLQVSFSPKDNGQIPRVSSLKGNYPNPVNPETTIKYELAMSGKTKLEVFNVKGQLVKTLLNGSVDAGSYSIKWNGKNNTGRSVSSGVYFYRMTTGGKCLTNKMLMLK